MPSFSWFNFLVVAAVLVISYSLMRLIHTFLIKKTTNNIWIEKLSQAIYIILKIYEIITGLILSAVFVFINPPLHGLMLLVTIIFGFSHIHNYVSGRLAMLESELTIGKRLKIGDAKGVIVKMSNTGLQLRTATGLRFVNYSRLFKEGYDLVAVEEVGGFYLFQIKPTSKVSKNNHLLWLQDAFLTTPYIDPQRLPELSIDENTHLIEARILLREDNDLNELVELVKEWGYDCSTKIDL